jgi:hypothetical protein
VLAMDVLQHLTLAAAGCALVHDGENVVIGRAGFDFFARPLRLDFV